MERSEKRVEPMEAGSDRDLVACSPFIHIGMANALQVQIPSFFRLLFDLLLAYVT